MRQKNHRVWHEVWNWNVPEKKEKRKKKKKISAPLVNRLRDSQPHLNNEKNFIIKDWCGSKTILRDVMYGNKYG